jgi:hypothetical protein
VPLVIPQLYLTADSSAAYASLVRRDIIRRVTRHKHGGQYGQDTIEGIEAFFDHWTAANSLVFVKYEALHNHLPDIAKALGVHFRRFPPHRPRKSHPAEDVPKRLLALRTSFDALPSFFVQH